MANTTMPDEVTPTMARPLIAAATWPVTREEFVELRLRVEAIEKALASGGALERFVQQVVHDMRRRSAVKR